MSDKASKKQEQAMPGVAAPSAATALTEAMTVRATTSVIWAATAGLSGTGSAGMLALAALRMNAEKPVSAGLWIVMAACTAAALLSLWFRYVIDKAYADAHRQAEARQTTVSVTLAETYEQIMVKGAAEPTHSGHYVDLSDAMARYAAVLCNRVQPADATQGKLYRRGSK